MQYEYIGALEVTYGNALAGGGGFHRVTTHEGNAAEITPATYLWYKLATATASSTVARNDARTEKDKDKVKVKARAKDRVSPSPRGVHANTAIVHLHIGTADEETAMLPAMNDAWSAGTWKRMDKAVDRQKLLYVWYYVVVDWRAPALSPPRRGSHSAASSGASQSSSNNNSISSSSLRMAGEDSDLMEATKPMTKDHDQPTQAVTTTTAVPMSTPLKEIRVVRDLKDVPTGFESLPTPLESEIVDKKGDPQTLRTFLCFRRLGRDDLMSSRWSLAAQKVGVWLDIRDLASGRWQVGQLVHMGVSECRVQITSWRSHRDEVVSLTTTHQRIAQLGTHTMFHLSPSYPYCRKQGSAWSFGMKELALATQEFDDQFVEGDVMDEYLQQHLVPLIEKSMLALYLSHELAEEVHGFHQHVLVKIVAWFLSHEGDDSVCNGAATPTGGSPTDQKVDTTATPFTRVDYLLAILRMIMCGTPSSMFFYLKYGGAYSSIKAQGLVFTSYLISSEAAQSVPSRHPARSFYFVDNVEKFLQAGGSRVILQRLRQHDVRLLEVVIFTRILLNAKPCLITTMLPSKRRRGTLGSRSTKSMATTVEMQLEDFFREFLHSVLARLRRASGEELRDEDGIIDHTINAVDTLFSDDKLLGEDESTDANGSDSCASGSSPSTSTTSLSLLSPAPSPTLSPPVSLHSSSDAGFAEAYEVFLLDLSKKYICCPYLSQRLLGVARLSDIVAMTQRRDSQSKKSGFHLKRSGSSMSSGFFSSASRAFGTSATELPATKWLRPKYFVEWLLASDVVEVVLGDDAKCAKYKLRGGIHLELVKRSRVVLEFVSRAGLFSETHISLLWKAAMGQLRSGKKAVLDILVLLSQEFSADLLDIVMILVTQVPVHEYDDLIVGFIQQLIEIAVKGAAEADAGAKKSLSSLVGVNALKSKRTLDAKRDADVYHKIVSLALSLLWSGIEHFHAQVYEEDAIGRTIMDNGASAHATPYPAMLTQITDAFAQSVNQVHRSFATGSSSISSSSKNLSQQPLYEYLIRCIDNITIGKDVEMSMTILQTVADAYGDPRTGASETSGSASATAFAMAKNTFQSGTVNSRDLLKDLGSLQSLVAVVVNEIKRYMGLARSSEFHDPAIPASASPERFLPSVHRTAMEKRLQFLGYLTTTSDLEVSYQGINDIWQCFMAEKSTVDERDVFFEWLTSVIVDPSDVARRALTWSNAFSAATTEAIFDDLIRSSADKVTSNSGILLDLNQINQSAFGAFVRLFQYVNASHQRIRCGPEMRTAIGTKTTILVESMDMKGLQKLYEIALKVANENVSSDAINYVIHLHLSLGTKPVCREIWSEFTQWCIAQLHRVLPIAELNGQEVFRVLTMLNTFLYQSVVVVKPTLARSRTGSVMSDAVETLDVYVRSQSGHTSTTLSYNLRRTVMVGELRDLIARDCNHPANRVRIVNEVKTKLTAQGHDRLTLERVSLFRITSLLSSSSSSKMNAVAAVPTEKRNYCVEAILLNKPENDTIDHVERAITVSTGGANGDSDWDVVKKRLSSSTDTLNLLLSLLSFREGICEEAWKLLKLLDTDVSMEKQFRTLQDTLAIDGTIHSPLPSSFDWEPLLDSSSPSKLVYQLDMLQRFALQPSSKTDMEERDNGKDAKKKDSPRTTAWWDQKALSESDRVGGVGGVNNWSISFSKLGGRQHLEKILLQSQPRQLVAQGPLTLMCYSRVLKLLRHFAVVDVRTAYDTAISQNVGMSDVTGNAQEDPSLIVEQVLRTMGCLHALQAAELALGVEQPEPADSTDNVGVSQSSSSYHNDPSSSDSIPQYKRPPLHDPDNDGGIPHEAHLIVRALSCLSTYALARGGDPLVLLERVEEPGRILLNFLIHSRVEKVRKEAAVAIALLCAEAKMTIKHDGHKTNDSENDTQSSCLRYFLTLLCSVDEPVREPEYYRLFTRLLAKARGDLSWLAFLPTSRTLCRRIKSYSILESPATNPGPRFSPKVKNTQGGLSTDKQRASVRPPDTLLEALLTTLLTLLKRIPNVQTESGDSSSSDDGSLRHRVNVTLHREEAIVREIYQECLFTGSDGEDHDPGRDVGASQRSAQYYLKQPKCRSQSCRKVAFMLLQELVKENPDGLEYLLVQMGGHHSLTPHPDPTNGGLDGDNSNANSAPPLSLKKKKAKAKQQQQQQSALLRQAAHERGKYVGLKNLGCTCYLNSTVQAFFMMPRFRREILRYPSERDGLVYQLQSVFAHLEGSAKPYFNPKALTSAMKTWEGESIDVTVQQDASEFLTSFFQQIESEMNHQEEEGNPLNTFFGGVFSNELVAEGDRYSERVEPFHFISVAVRDRKNLTESLDGWVEGDKVSYTWESSSSSTSKDGSGETSETPEEPEKVTLETHKRISIKQLPDQLIIHLKRFEFDFEAMQQIKLHDRFEFPMKLDMYPYTKEGQQEQRRRRGLAEGVSDRSVAVSSSSLRRDSTLSQRPRAPEYYQYELVGSVVHMGSAHSGHYYSFLREQDTTSDGLGGDSVLTPPQWYEFNDTLVSPFDPAEIPAECFGGGDEMPRRRLASSSSSSVASPSSSTSSASALRKKTRSSFMLIYARVQPKLVISRLLEQPSAPVLPAKRTRFVDLAVAVVFMGRLKDRARAHLKRLRQRAHVIAPESIKDMIMLENRLFWRKTYLYDRQCLTFTLQLLQSCLVPVRSSEASEVPKKVLEHRFMPAELRFQALQLATAFVFGTLWQSEDVATMVEWKPVLCTLYRDDVRGAHWLLQSLSKNELLLRELLICSPSEQVRELTATVLFEAIATSSHHAAATEAAEASNETSASSDSLGSTGSGSGTSKPRRRRRTAKAFPPEFDLVFLLFRTMPTLLTVPAAQHHEYFSVILQFVLGGQNECVFAIVNSVLGAIVGLLTGQAGSQLLLQPELKRVKGRTILKSIELDRMVLKLLALLIRCCPPPAVDVADAVIPANMAQHYTELPSADRTVLFSERFVTLLTQHATHYTKQTKWLEQVITYLCWESCHVTSLFLQTILHGVQHEDDEDIKPYFRTLSILFKLKDSLAADRVAQAMLSLVATMASQQRYVKATITSLEMLSRLAKRHGRVRKWLRTNRESCLWMEKWVCAHRGPEGYLQQLKTTLVKPNSTSAWVGMNPRSPGMVRSMDRSMLKLLPRIRGMLDDSGELEAPLETFYDSDDNPMRLVGKRVKVKWAKEKWYEGVVERFDPEAYEHYVAYDDGDRRMYRMSDKIFYVIEPAAETTSMSGTNAANSGGGGGGGGGGGATVQDATMDI